MPKLRHWSASCHDYKRWDYPKTISTTPSTHQGMHNAPGLWSSISSNSPLARRRHRCDPERKISWRLRFEYPWRIIRNPLKKLDWDSTPIKKWLITSDGLRIWISPHSPLKALRFDYAATHFHTPSWSSHGRADPLRNAPGHAVKVFIRWIQWWI